MAQQENLQDNTMKLNEIIRDIPVAMLTTQQKDGSLHARPMLTQDYPSDGLLWFFTRRDTAKTIALQDHPQVNLSYCDPQSERYVSIAGQAQLSDDKGLAYDLWSSRYRAWFPEGLDDPELCLIRVEVESAEYWDASSSSLIRIAGFINAATHGKAYEGGKHEKLNLRGRTPL